MSSEKIILIMMLVISLFIVVISGCTSLEGDYENSILSFKIPENWTVDNSNSSDAIVSLKPQNSSSNIISIQSSDSDTSKIIETIQEITKTYKNYIGDMISYENQLKKIGFPLQFLNYTQAPFDLISDFLRGMRGSMLDMYRKPEELKKLMDILTQPAIGVIAQIAQLFPRYKVVFIALHRGADGFMSLKQFEEFYWPSLTKVMDGLIERGLIPMPHFQGKYDERFVYLEEYAKKNKGKLIYRFGQSDIIRAKEMFGEYVCLRGNVPSSLLSTGTPQQVDKYMEYCIEKLKVGGGYLIDADAGIPDEAKPENVKAMCNDSFKYGIYRN